jgi:arylsulfatase A-like enzyme
VSIYHFHSKTISKRRARSGLPASARTLAGTLVIAILGCGLGEPPPRPNIILVTIDTLRADRLGLYGYTEATSPNIDRLAEDSVVFDAAVTTCPATAPSIASVLTGHHRATHGVVRNGTELRADVTTLAEALKSGGYQTAGVVSNPVLSGELGFGQGFETFGTPENIDSSGPGRFGGEPVVARALDLVDSMGEGPFFLWVHFMDPHGAYFPPEDQRALFDAADYAWPGDVALPVVEENHAFAAIPRYQRVVGQSPGAQVDPAELRARYDAEVHYVDQHVGVLIDGLRERGVWGDSLFVLTSDHGESLGEHNYYFQHGFYAYEDSLNVPLLIRYPRRFPKPKRIGASISLLDISPTIIELAGRPPLENIEGVSAIPMIDGRESNRTAFAVTYYGNRLVALRRGNMKYVYTPPPPTPDEDRRRNDGWKKHWPTRENEELYDLSIDVGEVRSLERKRPELALRFRDEVRNWLADQAERGRAFSDLAARNVVDRELEAQLEALGYIE